MYSGGGIVAVFLVFNYLLLFLSLSFSSAQFCPKYFQCGSYGNLSFPFTDQSQPNCGFLMANCSNQSVSLVHQERKRWYEINGPLQKNSIRLHDPQLGNSLNATLCSSFSTNNNIQQQNSGDISFTILSNITVFKCRNGTSTNLTNTQSFQGFTSYVTCHDFTIFYRTPPPPPLPLQPQPLPLPTGCEPVTMPMVPLENITGNHETLFDLLTPDFDLNWNLTEKCVECFRLGHCQVNNNSFCANVPFPGAGKPKLGVIVGAVGGVLFILACSAFFLACYHKRRIKGVGSYLRSRSIGDPTASKTDLEGGGGSLYLGVHVFSYTELEHITNNFNDSNELGNGGFGTVYYGKLKDGREVAVKYLYEHNFRRMQQFKTEIEILTRLRHQNLVSLYGCTSRHSRDLLLVYEYVSNGTVADHLHGTRAKETSLPWLVRMNIAIETAGALAYLHASDIIHRDIKTNNILLGSNFCVKVADFGLSRLFPNDVTHISTAPQGTPGYVDPEYHQCYQLTDKSDVYSFGVVLIELISAMPAVDMSRKSHDINLANFAVNRIQRRDFDELIDPSLHINSDPEVSRMTTSVAELAFRCLQHEKEMRPTMEEVAEILKQIQQYEDSSIGNSNTNENGASIQSTTSNVHPSPESDQVVLLRKDINLPSSPTSVTDTWNSVSSTGTPNRS